MKSPQFVLHAALEEKHWWFLGRRSIVRKLVAEGVHLPKRETIVDIGCGTGANIGIFAENYSCIGIDSSAEAIALAKSRFKGVRFLCDPAPSRCVAVLREASVCLLMDVLEHVPDDFYFFSEILSVMRPGSHLLLTVPADQSLWSKHDVSFGHYRRYDDQRLEHLWKDLPVTVRLFSYFNSRLYPVVKIMRSVNRFKGTAAGKEGTDFALPTAPVNAVLTSIFGGESRVLLDLFHSKRRRGYSHGVSLVALLRREEGIVSARQKPVGCPPDIHDPKDKNDS